MGGKHSRSRIISGVKLLEHNAEEIDKLDELVANINGTGNLINLQKITVDSDKYDENKVPARNSRTNQDYNIAVDIDVKKVRKNLLDLSQDLQSDIESKNVLTDLPNNFRQNDINILNDFKGASTNPCSLTDQQILDYRQQSTIPANIACQAIVPNYHGDTNLNAAVMNEHEIDKVNDIIRRIDNETNPNNLISETAAINYTENQVPASKSHTAIKNKRNAKKNQLDQTAQDQHDRTAAIQSVTNYYNNLNISERINDICAKVQPDITVIETELNKKPVISSSELSTDYQSALINLATNDTQRTTRKQEIIAEINQVRSAKLDQIRQIITNAQEILNQDGATKEELEPVIQSLKTLADAPADSAEKIVWEENSDTNHQLLTDLEAKLNQITPPEQTPNHDQPTTPNYQPTKDTPQQPQT
ncbi:10305_t:CDS:2, partial [Entrophospora sp. SA101]